MSSSNNNSSNTIYYFLKTVKQMALSCCNVTQSENDEAKVSEIEVTSVTRLGQKAEPSDFELLKVLGQGSFGKVSH